eukprot:NODE_3390_length_1228_cov_51.065158_g3217_i0.p1 GENE.NODE_3390_length_1228_cov_51.065158_g3217_i0~~NODE_3390_length_1228_cov_51.065158_g3217_i0.p1  ORF type:complete len:330 (+),score=35.87 NODE_3390_length_1228_cov_51.065158_g3217_i0:42-1031(+)
MPSVLQRFRDKLKGQTPEPTPAKDSRVFHLNEHKVTDHYAIKHFLGKGSFSTVHLGTDKRTKTDVAIKIVQKHSIDFKVEALKSEVRILMNVKHPNIVNLLDVYEDDDKVYLIMELMTGGELFDRICNDFPNGTSEKHSAILTAKIIDAVRYLHGRGIIHRDLKPENLLFSSPDKENCEIKISDFGLAKIWSGDMLVKTACGSPNYVAPEVLLNEVHGYGFACDMWSVGVILYVLLCGFCPFFDECTPALFASITSGNYTFPSPFWDPISEDAKDLIRKLLVVDTAKRLTPEQALEHKWLTNAPSLRDDLNPNVTAAMKKIKEAPKGDA